jgi:hypothetical protein
MQFIGLFTEVELEDHHQGEHRQQEVALDFEVHLDQEVPQLQEVQEPLEECQPLEEHQLREVGHPR